jgi:hypothetical protein
MEYTLFDQFQYEGVWFTPENPDNRMFGILSYEPGERINLKLIQAAGGLGDFMGAGGNFEILQGITANPDIKHVTLINCRSGNARTGMGDTPSYYDCSVEYAMFGVAFGELQDIQFEKAVLNLTNTEEWFNHNAFTAHSADFLLEHIDYHPITPVEAYVPLINSAVRIRSKFMQSQFNPSKYVQIKHAPVLELEPNRFKGFEWYLNKFNKLQNLFTLLYGRAAYQKQVIGFHRLHYQNTEDEDRTYVQEVYIYFGQKKAKEPKPIDYQRLVFSYNNIEPYWANILNAWFNRHHFIKTLLEMLLPIEYGDNRSVNFQLLALTQGLESYHRNCAAGLYIPPSEYEHLFETLKLCLRANHLPADLRDSLKSRLKYGNEYSQRKRFNLLLKMLPSRFTERFRLDRREMGRIVDARNKYTHYANHKHYALQRPVRYDLRLIARWCYQLKVFSKLLIYKELGIPITLSYRAISRMDDYNATMRFIDILNNRSETDYHFISS